MTQGCSIKNTVARHHWNIRVGTAQRSVATKSLHHAVNEERVSRLQLEHDVSEQAGIRWTCRQDSISKCAGPIVGSGDGIAHIDLDRGETDVSTFSRVKAGSS